MLFSVGGEDYRPRDIDITIDKAAEINSTFCTQLEIFELVVDDGIVEENESFLLQLVYPELLIGSPDSVNITIQDNDGKYKLMFKAATRERLEVDPS